MKYVKHKRIARKAERVFRPDGFEMHFFPTCNIIFILGIEGDVNVVSCYCKRSAGLLQVMPEYHRLTIDINRYMTTYMYILDLKRETF